MYIGYTFYVYRLYLFNVKDMNQNGHKSPEKHGEHIEGFSSFKNKAKMEKTYVEIVSCIEKQNIR